MIGPRHRVIGAGFGAIAALRAHRWLAPLTRGTGLILTFHHVRPRRDDPFQPNALLEITPEHLDRTLTIVRELGFDIVPLDDVPERLQMGRDGRPFVVLTFDDGYRDNKDVAAPILARHGAPWSLFVTTDYAAGTGRLWWIELEEAIRASDRLSLWIEGGSIELPTAATQEKNLAFARVYKALRAGPEAALRDTIARLCDKVGIDRDALVRSLCLGFDEIDAMATDGALTIGAHTLTHPMLAKADEATVHRELTRGRSLLSERFGRDVRHVAYPVGDPGSAGPREFRLAAEAGYATGVTTRPGHLFPAHAAHLTALPRVSVNGLHQTDAALRALLSGVPFLAWNRGRRVNID